MPAKIAALRGGGVAGRKTCDGDGQVDEALSSKSESTELEMERLRVRTYGFR